MNQDGTPTAVDMVQISEKLARIETLLSEKVGSLEKRVGQLESNQRWLILLVVGSVIYALLSKVGL
ncbi:hypothetical protein [Cellulosilyticum lentocellum]|uniref:Hemolysin XhlA n=1 Tax=Cellulosilyticum lentocellum (strain ATCC 49066 / DSM 5427 / NCIMB 11756 / RHM5) TaxID=642492 RepID=F2JNY3_CELLD|nr:hypothetical protein [Cellulosilyticum lentocellum]ADZ83597.1 hypothetical protein Clole_1877 [Cellulosilyticum lentocellum DSM 5427]